MNPELTAMKKKAVQCVANELYREVVATAHCSNFDTVAIQTIMGLPAFPTADTGYAPTSKPDLREVVPRDGGQAVMKELSAHEEEVLAKFTKGETAEGLHRDRAKLSKRDRRVPFTQVPGIIPL